MVTEGHWPSAYATCVRDYSCTDQQLKVSGPMAGAMKHGLHCVMSCLSEKKSRVRVNPERDVTAL